MTAAVLVAIVATVGIATVVVVATLEIQRVLLKLQRVNRKVRLLQLWSRERRADLARLVSLWLLWDGMELLGRFETELKKQSRYVGLGWTRTPSPAEGPEEPTELTSAELLELLDLSRELGGVA